MNNSNVNTTSPMDLTEPSVMIEPTYPGKGVGYDWRAVVAEAAVADLDAELAAELAAAH
jgi:hypothetical protein